MEFFEVDGISSEHLLPIKHDGKDGRAGTYTPWPRRKVEWGQRLTASVGEADPRSAVLSTISNKGEAAPRRLLDRRDRTVSVTVISSAREAMTLASRW
jgi:hypothetical protein